MITDKETNVLYLANTLPKEYAEFYKLFKIALEDNSYNSDKLKFLTKTKDIWAVDYMPIQVTKEKFVRFNYNPDYLHWNDMKHLITNAKNVPETAQFSPKYSSLKVEGGNVIKGENKVIMCDKVLKDNITWKKSQKQIIDELINCFQVEEIIFIPTHPDDFIGHADGMIRFIDDDNVIINNLKDEDINFGIDFISVLKEHKLNYVEIPFKILNAKDEWDARGVYINYLQMQDILFVSQFKFKADDIATRILSDTFPKSKIVPVLCNSIAKDGGVLNCISWNILKP